MNKLVTGLFFIFVLSSPLHACTGLLGASIDGSNNFTIRLNSGTQTVAFAVLPSGSGVNKAKALQANIQEHFDVRQTLLSLPADDPDKTVNPNRESLFWSLSDGTPETNPARATHLTGRSCAVSVIWDGTTFTWTFTNTASR